MIRFSFWKGPSWCSLNSRGEVGVDLRLEVRWPVGLLQVPGAEMVLA